MALEQLLETIWEFVNIPVSMINGILTASFPNNEVPFLFLLSFVIGFFLKQRWKEGKIGYIVISLMAFSFLRWLGVGN